MAKANKISILDEIGVEQFSIGETGTRRLTKKELIDIIEKNFPSNYGTIAVVTHSKTRNYDTGEEIIMQSVTFGKVLEV